MENFISATFKETNQLPMGKGIEMVSYKASPAIQERILAKAVRCGYETELVGDRLVIRFN